MTLLTANTLVFQQVTAMMSNDFAIHDGEGTVAGHIHTHGSLGSLLAKGSRHFTILDAGDQPLLVVRDPLNFVRDTFVLENPDGTEFGQVRKRFTFFNQRLDIDLASGEAIELKGNLLGLEFIFHAQGQEVARASRQWSGLARGLLGRSTYTLTFVTDVPADRKKAIIGTMIALDLVRRKDSNS